VIRINGRAAGAELPEIRELVPRAIAVLCRRGADFASAEDAVQEALVESLGRWENGEIRDPLGWLVAVAWRRFLDSVRSDSARHSREMTAAADPAASPATPNGDSSAAVDDTLELYRLCGHPSLGASSAVALTLRAVAGLTTAQIAAAYLVPEKTMGQRISRAKAKLRGVRLGESGSIRTVLKVLYLVFNEGFSGDVDLETEAIRLASDLRARRDHPEVSGLLALMLLHNARRPARFDSRGGVVPLDEQDRRLWDRRQTAEAIGILRSALARDELGEYQAQAAIAALHADAPAAAETDWPQIVEWYDELLALGPNPVAALGRVVAVGEAEGPHAGMAALVEIDPGVPRREAVEARLAERAGELPRAARLYAAAAESAATTAERDYLRGRAARAANSK